MPSFSEYITGNYNKYGNQYGTQYGGMFPTPKASDINIEEILKTFHPKDISKLTIEDLVAQINSQGEKIEAQGEKKPKTNRALSAVTRVFDVIQRPTYAVANIADEIIKGGDIADVAREAGKGLAGTDKSTFSDVLETAGVENKWVKGIGGLGLDIALDPLTYATLGGSVVAKTGIKGGSKLLAGEKAAGVSLAAKTAQAKASAKVLEAGSPRVGKRVTEKFLEDFVAKGLGKTSENLSESGIKKLSARILQDEAYEAGLAASKQVIDEGARQFGVKAFGRSLPGLQSQKLQTAGEKLSAAFKSTNIGSGLSKTFQTKHLFPGPIKNFKREAEGFSYSEFANVERSIRSVFKGVAKEDQRRITHALEIGEDLTGQVGAKGNDLGVLQKEAKDWLDSITQQEISMGILDPKNAVDNYVYHFYKAADRDKVNEFKKLRKKTKDGKKYSIEAAEVAGLKPIREIGDILQLRAAKSYTEQGQAKFMDAVAKEFGVHFGKGGKKLADRLDLVKANNKYINELDVYVPKEVQKSIQAITGLYNNLDETNNLLRLFDKNLAHWKFGATAINPGHHIRNMVGDMFLNFMDGVQNPYRYLQSSRILLREGKTKIKVGKGQVDDETIRRLYNQKGTKSGYTRVEIGSRKFAPTEKIREFSEGREDFTRMAHFIDALKKEGASLDPKSANYLTDLDRAASRAAARVRKFNIDYGDLTDAEKKVFKRVVPFYTWMRKNIPLQLESLALAPGRQAVVPKSFQALNQVLGNDDDYPTIGGLQTVPKWIREMAGIQILGEGEGRAGVYFDPSTLIPSMDTLSMISEPLEAGLRGDIEGVTEAVSQEGLNVLNPLLRGSVELGTGRNTFTGSQRQQGTGYFAGQLPLGRLIHKFATGEADRFSVANYLTGASLRDIREPQILGELRRQQDSYENVYSTEAELEERGLLTPELLNRYSQITEQRKRERLARILETYNKTLER